MPAAAASLSPDALSEMLQEVTSAFQVEMACCTFKRPLVPAGDAAAAAAAPARTNTLKAGGNRRFSAVAYMAADVREGDENPHMHIVMRIMLPSKNNPDLVYALGARALRLKRGDKYIWDDEELGWEALGFYHGGDTYEPKPYPIEFPPCPVGA